MPKNNDPVPIQLSDSEQSEAQYKPVESAITIPDGEEQKS